MDKTLKWLLSIAVGIAIAISLMLGMVMYELQVINMKLDQLHEHAQPTTTNWHEYQFDIIDDLPEGLSVRLYANNPNKDDDYNLLGDACIEGTELERVLRSDDINNEEYRLPLHIALK